MFREALKYVSQCCRQFHVGERDLEPLSFGNVQVAQLEPCVALRHLGAALLAWKSKYQAHQGEKKTKRKKNKGKLKLAQGKKNRKKKKRKSVLLNASMYIFFN